MKGRKAHLVGGGLASLASAAYLIKDGGIAGENITIYEESPTVGGSLDAQGATSDGGYIMRGFRMLENKVYSCLYDLLSFIPSLQDPTKTVLEEFNRFNENLFIDASARLVENGRIVQSYPFRLHLKDRLSLLWFLTRREEALSNLTIEDYFSSSFFSSNFWLQFCTTFSFQPWHSLVEFRRYILRFYHVSPQLSSMACVQLSPHNEYESIVLPVTKWLQKQGVCFELKIQVVDLAFRVVRGRKSVQGLDCRKEGQLRYISVDADDMVFATLGSMTADSNVGSMDRAPQSKKGSLDSSWRLWENLAAKDAAFGRPSTFSGDREKSKWTSFSITCRGPAFVNRLQQLTGKETGKEGVITIKGSNWLLSFAMTPYPYFQNQPKNVNVCWGYGLTPEKIGNHITKTMSSCSGKEILVELCSHLGMQSEMEEILSTTTCIPCSLPYITSQFLPRTALDRPRVIPETVSNLAVLGQFCEIPDDIVFTLEYSVRAAQTGVYSLLNLPRKVTPIYKGYRNALYGLRTVRTVMKPTIPESVSSMVGESLSRAALILLGISGGFYALAVNIF